MIKPINYQKDTQAWIAQVWVSFFLSLGFTVAGISNLPVDKWTRGFLGIGYLYSLSSAFTLAKTIRDNQEAERLTSRIDEARVEKILAEHHPLK